MDFFVYPVGEFTELVGFAGLYLLPNLGEDLASFSPFLETFFFTMLFLFSFWDSHDVHLLCLAVT